MFRCVDMSLMLLKFILPFRNLDLYSYFHHLFLIKIVIFVIGYVTSVKMDWTLHILICVKYLCLVQFLLNLESQGYPKYLLLTNLDVLINVVTDRNNFCGFSAKIIILFSLWVSIFNILTLLVLIVEIGNKIPFRSNTIQLLVQFGTCGG